MTITTVLEPFFRDHPGERVPEENLLPDQLRDFDCTESAFRQSLKTFFFDQY